MHPAALAFVKSVAHDRPPGLVVELGGFNVNGTVRQLFSEPYICTDVRAGEGIDVVADGATYVPPTPPACVVCCEVFEHTAEAQAICRNVYQMLQPGGVFIVTMAGEGRMPHSATGRPVTWIEGIGVIMEEYYANVTADALRAWLSDFAAVRVVVDPVACDLYAVALKGA